MATLTQETSSNGEEIGSNGVAAGVLPHRHGGREKLQEERDLRKYHRELHLKLILPGGHKNVLRGHQDEEWGRLRAGGSDHPHPPHPDGRY